jgi:hypothetical protein
LHFPTPDIAGTAPFQNVKTHRSAVSAGLSALWRETKGDRRVCVAILDAPIDLSHPCLASANLIQDWSGDSERCSSHGTQVASIIFAAHDTSVLGIAPQCRGISAPIFNCEGPRTVVATRQSHVAAGIRRALAAGAQIINVSAGQLVPTGEADWELSDAVRRCVAAGALIVAAAGNDGCECLHVPAALPSVLSVGAMRDDGQPLEMSNWGTNYRQQGILAPGENIVVAGGAGRVELRTGTSYAAAYVSGVAALLLSRELQRGRVPEPLLISKALLATVSPCDPRAEADCRRFLAGRLDIVRAMSYLDHWSDTMTDDLNANLPSESVSAAGSNCGTNNELGSNPLFLGAEPEVNGPRPYDVANPQVQSHPKVEAVTASACASCRGERQLVYALGRLGYDFGTEACRDAFTVRMRHWLDSERKHEGGPHHEANPLDEAQMVAFLRAMAEREPWHASALLWTLNLGGYPLYVVRPEGPFARDAYNRVRHFFDEQHEGEAERVAVPGDITGQATLLNGLKVPVINPDLRGLCNWNRCKLIQAVLECPIEGDQVSETSELERSLHEFLDRIYFEMQNAGRTARDRALNYAGTNLFHYRVIHSKLRHQTALDTIGAEPSTICRPGSDCWDITLAFFDPRQPLQTIRKIFRYTIDVSDALPVTVSDIRSWAARVA